MAKYRNKVHVHYSCTLFLISILQWQQMVFEGSSWSLISICTEHTAVMRIAVIWSPLKLHYQRVSHFFNLTFPNAQRVPRITSCKMSAHIFATAFHISNSKVSKCTCTSHPSHLLSGRSCPSHSSMHAARIPSNLSDSHYRAPPRGWAGKATFALYCGGSQYPLKRYL